GVEDCLPAISRVLKNSGIVLILAPQEISHRIRTALDDVFGEAQFRNEILVPSTMQSNRAARSALSHATVIAYAKTAAGTLREEPVQRTDHFEAIYRHIEDVSGRRYALTDCTQRVGRPELQYEWNGFTRVWRWPRAEMESLL